MPALPLLCSVTLPRDAGGDGGMSAELLRWIAGWQTARVPRLLWLTSSLEMTQRKWTWAPRLPPPHWTPGYSPSHPLHAGNDQIVGGCSPWGLFMGSVVAGKLQDSSSGSDCDPERPWHVLLSSVRTAAQHHKDPVRRSTASMGLGPEESLRSIWRGLLPGAQYGQLVSVLPTELWGSPGQGGAWTEDQAGSVLLQGSPFSLASHTAGSSMTKLFFEERFAWPEKKKKKILEIFVDARDWISMSAIFSPGFAAPQTFLWYFWNETTDSDSSMKSQSQHRLIFFPTSALEPQGMKGRPLSRSPRQRDRMWGVEGRSGDWGQCSGEVVSWAPIRPGQSPGCLIPCEGHL